jgi:thiosulfate/3-mercaptopyruvate sulfurtransferase
VIPVVVTPEDVPALLVDRPDTAIVDVRWYLDGRDGRAAFEAGHLPGARWVDLDRALAAHDRPPTEGRHPFPSPEAFAAAMSDLGIGDDTTVVAYDDTGGLTAGRLVVMLRMLGHDAAVLDGGLAAWTGPLEVGAATAPEASAHFTARPWPTHRFAAADDVADLAAGTGVVLDARVRERFTGEQALIDPRPGHVPGARNAPWSAVLDASGRIAAPDALRAHFGALGVTPERVEAGGVATYCGSGVSACMNLVALEHAGLGEARLYVASWSGWAADPDRPAETGG